MQVFEITQLNELKKSKKIGKPEVLPNGKIGIMIDGDFKVFKDRADLKAKLKKETEKIKKRAISLIGAAIGAGTLILIEVLIYVAADKLAEFIVVEAIKDSDLERQVQDELIPMFATILGLSSVEFTDARDGKKDAEGNIQSRLSSLTMADIDKIANFDPRTIDPKELEDRIQDMIKDNPDPEFEAQIRKYIRDIFGREKISIRDLVRKNQDVDDEKSGTGLGFESIQEDKDDTDTALYGFAKHIAKKYNKQVAIKMRKKMKQELLKQR